MYIRANTHIPMNRVYRNMWAYAHTGLNATCVPNSSGLVIAWNSPFSITCASPNAGIHSANVYFMPVVCHVLSWTLVVVLEFR